jgi:hypothetical protein
MAGLFFSAKRYHYEALRRLEGFMRSSHRIDWKNVFGILAGIAWLAGVSAVAYRLIVGSIR